MKCREHPDVGGEGKPCPLDRVKPGRSSDVAVLQRRVYELEKAIGSATRISLDVCLQLLPADAKEDRSFVQNVRDRLEKAMDRSVAVWPDDP